MTKDPIHAWTSLVDRFDRAEWTALVVPMLLLLFVGDKATKAHPKCRSLGLGIASMLFLLGLVRRFLVAGSDYRLDIAGAIVHSLVVAGVGLGIAWIALPPLFWLFERTVVALFRSVIRAVVAIVRILLLPWTTAMAWHRHRRFTRRQIEEGKRRKVEDEQVRQKLEAQQVEAARERARRDDARAACDCLYTLYRHALEEKLPQSEFDAFKNKHLGEDRSAEYVQRLGAQLQDIIVKLVRELKPAAVSYDKLSRWYEETLDAIEKLPADDRIKRSQVAQLNRRFTDLLDARLEEVDP